MTCWSLCTDRSSHHELMSTRVSPPSVLFQRSMPPTITKLLLVESPAQIAFPYQPCLPRNGTAFPAASTPLRLEYVWPPSTERQISPVPLFTLAYTIAGFLREYVSSTRSFPTPGCVTGCQFRPPSVV